MLLDNDEKEENAIHCCFSLHNIFPCYFENVEVINLFDNCERYMAIFLMWFICVIGFTFLTIYRYSQNNNLNIKGFVMYLIIFCLFICYQIIFTCLMTPFIIICLVHPKFIDKIMKFLQIRL